MAQNIALPTRLEGAAQPPPRQPGRLAPRSRFRHETVQVAERRQPAYGLANAGVAFTTGDGAWRFSLDGKNLFDHWYRVAGYDFGGAGTGLLASVSQIGFYGPPRTYQVTAQ
jgi:TonB dependent receptor